MQQDSRDSIFSALIKVTFHCQQHPEEIANMIIINQESQLRSLMCSSCLALMPAQAKQIQSLKMALFQIHQTSKGLLSHISAAAFVDHHMNLIRGIVRHHYKQNETLLLCSVNNWFLKYRQLLTGRFFSEFYSAGAQIVENSKKNGGLQGITALRLKRIKKLMNFIDTFYNLVTSFEDYQKMSTEEVMSGQNLVRQIKGEVGQLYKQFKQKAQNTKHYQLEQIFQLFNPSQLAGKAFRFSSTLVHSALKVTDHKTIKMPNLPDNEYTLLALIEPSIGDKKRSIKLKMAGIKGWVAAGVAIRSKVEANAYRFEQPNHGTFQISYDGYSWSEDSSVNEQYTSWYFNQNDTLMITANPSIGELVFMKNEEQNSTYSLKFKSQKKDKLYFCVSVNYYQDSVAIVQ